ncbi:hypothetical protein ACJX0J_039744, partial [Zea mays]
SSRLSHSGISHLPADEVKPLVKYDNDEDAHSPSGRGRGRGGRGRGRGRGRGGRGNGFNEYVDAGWEDDHAPAYMGNGYARGRGRSFRGRDDSSPSAALGTWFVIYFMAIQTCFFDNFELKVYIIVYSRIILSDEGQKSEPLRFWFILPMNTNKPLFVPFVNEIFESTKGTYGAATDEYVVAHMKLGNGTQMKFSPFEGFAPHPIELGTDGHNPEEIKNVLGWMEQALIIQDCDYRPIFLLLVVLPEI